MMMMILWDGVFYWGVGLDDMGGGMLVCLLL
jgi:hypothetical protein